jgi:hypothetical protein
MVDASEGKRENVVDGERITEPSGVAADPAVPLLVQHLQAQAPVGRAVPACRRTPTTAGTLALVDPAASARPACRDYLPVPTDAGKRAHVGRTRSPLKVCSSSSRR